MPAGCGGEVTVSEVAESTWTSVPATPSNSTEFTPVNPAPVTVTVVPPPAGPRAGAMPVTWGDATYSNRSAVTGGLVPYAVVTLTSTVPAAEDGAMTSRAVMDSTESHETFVAPKWTLVTLRK